jgi:hypothetical protein
MGWARESRCVAVPGCGKGGMSKEIRAAPAAGSTAGHCNFEQFGVRLERSLCGQGPR